MQTYLGARIGRDKSHRKIAVWRCFVGVESGSLHSYIGHAELCVTWLRTLALLAASQEQLGPYADLGIDRRRGQCLTVSHAGEGRSATKDH